MLRKLIAKQVISEAEAVELLPEFVSLNPPDPETDTQKEVATN